MSAAAELRWLAGEEAAGGARERGFVVEHGGEAIRGVAWLPAAAPRGLVLFGHGLTKSKRSSFHLPWARELATRHGVAGAAIDAPCHGDRAEPGASPQRIARSYRDYWRTHGGERIAAELAATARALQRSAEVGPVPLGYWGLSLGTQYGLAFLASSPSVRAAVLGLFGLAGPRVAAWAERARCPVLFVRQLDDELHAPASTQALFERLACEEKLLRSSPGRHEEVPREVHEAALDFLAARLGAGAQRTDRHEASALP